MNLGDSEGELADIAETKTVQWKSLNDRDWPGPEHVPYPYPSYRVKINSVERVILEQVKESFYCFTTGSFHNCALQFESIPKVIVLGITSTRRADSSENQPAEPLRNWPNASWVSLKLPDVVNATPAMPFPPTPGMQDQISNSFQTLLVQLIL